MKRITMKLLFPFTVAALLVFGALPVPAQQTSRFSVTTGDVALSGAGTKLTIQQPASHAAQVNLESAVIYCSVACDVTQSSNGAAATSTAGTANALLPFNAAALATVWLASNVGAGTPADGILHLAATERLPIDVSKIQLRGMGTGTNYTFVVSAVTGTVNITLFWSER